MPTILIEDALHQLVVGNDGLRGLVGDRIYAVSIPQFEKGKIIYPVMVYKLTARERFDTHDGPDKLVKSHYQVVCIGPDYLATKLVANKFVLATHGKAKMLEALYDNHCRRMVVESEMDADLEYDEVEQFNVYPVVLDLLIQHREDLDG